MVFMADAGMDVQTFDDEAAATAALEALPRDPLGDSGGLVVLGDAVVADKLDLKFMSKEDFLEFFERAKAPAPQQTEAETDTTAIISRTIQERMSSLTALAPEIGRLKTEQIFGKPSEALIEFAKYFPQYVTLGGCMMRGNIGGTDTPPTPPPES